MGWLLAPHCTLLCYKTDCHIFLGISYLKIQYMIVHNSVSRLYVRKIFKNPKVVSKLNTYISKEPSTQGRKEPDHSIFYKMFLLLLIGPKIVYILTGVWWSKRHTCYLSY